MSSLTQMNKAEPNMKTPPRLKKETSNKRTVNEFEKNLNVSTPLFYASSSYQNSPDPSDIPIPWFPPNKREGQDINENHKPASCPTSPSFSFLDLNKTDSLRKMLNISPPPENVTTSVFT